MTTTKATSDCQAAIQYYTCGCRNVNIIPICFIPKCPHSSPSLLITGLPNACCSPQIATRVWQIRGCVPRTLACTALNPSITAFTREEDTAGRLDSRNLLNLDGIEGLCHKTFDRVLPMFIHGDWRTEVLALYEVFKNKPVPVAAGIIGDRRHGYSLVSLSAEEDPYKYETLPEYRRRVALRKEEKSDARLAQLVRDSESDKPESPGSSEDKATRQYWARRKQYVPRFQPEEDRSAATFWGRRPMGPFDSLATFEAAQRSYTSQLPPTAPSRGAAYRVRQSISRPIPSSLETRPVQKEMPPRSKSSSPSRETPHCAPVRVEFDMAIRKPAGPRTGSLARRVSPPTSLNLPKPVIELPKRPMVTTKHDVGEIKVEVDSQVSDDDSIDLVFVDAEEDLPFETDAADLPNLGPTEPEQARHDEIRSMRAAEPKSQRPGFIALVGSYLPKVWYPGRGKASRRKL
ncbi:hypothetical protein BJ170DRAFT_722344 [Xylariales sp. AK1849]|nr:hypothetical protein BJ170DRAFT_722344 [Xylariales sp. AK1849]